jgi:Tfp pilus assembly protein PilN
MINLLSPNIKEERVYGRRNRTLLGYSFVLLLTAAAIAMIMIISLQFVGSDESKLRKEIDNTAVEISALETSIKSIESVASRLDTAKQVSDLSVKFSDLIPKIGAVLPEGVILNALSLTGGIADPLQLDVDITSAGLAPILVRNLVESDLFEAADISSITPKGLGEETVDGESSKYTFTASLTASFTGSADLKKKAAAAAAAAAAALAAEAEEAGAQ